MTSAGLVVFAILAAIAAFHVAWGFGVLFPARSERQLVAMVVGATGRSTMPRRGHCLLAASAIFAAGILALLETGTGYGVAGGVVTAMGIAASVLFLARAGAAYTPEWRRRFSLQPFATLDRALYAPLCLGVALVFALLSLNRLGALA